MRDSLQTLERAALWVEAFLCLAPLAGILWWSTILLPNWILMSIQFFGGDAKGANPWEAAYVAALIPLVPWALVGFAAMMRLVYLLSKGVDKDARRRFTAYSVLGWLIGVLGFAAIGLAGSGSWTFFIPAAATFHILFVARRLLIPGGAWSRTARDRITTGCSGP